MKYAKFACGCSFPMSDDGKINFEIDWDTLNYDCKSTWDLISSGNTKGIFQIESRFGRQLAKAARVDNIEDLANLVAIMRPGSTQAFLEDGKNLTTHYLSRKSGKEEVTYLHPSLEKSLKSTYGILTYQEQAMRIAQELAGFNLMEADDLRKAAGKKKPELMAKIKIKFIEGCKVTGVVNEKEAAEIWGWIEASQRYSFNKSHAVGYAYMSYLTAYIKQHFPLQMFTSWLGHANEKGAKKKEEIYELISNARSMDFAVNGPRFSLLNEHFAIVDEEIYFGFTEVSGLGGAVYQKIVKVVNELEPEIGKPADWSYMDLMMRFFTKKVGSQALKAMIMIGAFDYISSKRSRMFYEYERVQEITDKPLEWCIANYRGYSSVTSLLKACVNEFKFRQPASKNKMISIIDTLENPPYKLDDTAELLAGEEKRLLGISLTCSAVDGCKNASAANTTCREFLNGKNGYSIIAVNVETVKEIIIKNGQSSGKKMAFITVSDTTSILERVIAFPEVWDKMKGIITPSNTILLCGNKSNKDDSFIVENAIQI